MKENLDQQVCKSNAFQLQVGQQSKYQAILYSRVETIAPLSPVHTENYSFF